MDVQKGRVGSESEKEERVNSKALSGEKVLECGNFIGGPYCAKLLADFGAEVIKIEEPQGGDEARRYGPFLDNIPHPEKSGLFLYLNTNKLAITLNIQLPTGREIFKKLIKEVDILVENNPPQMMKDLGLGYESLNKLNPHLIMTSISPYGQTGPYRNYKGYDINTSALGGMSMCIGEQDREPLTPPLFLGHYQTGAAGAVGTMFALFAREFIGQGQHVDVSEADVWAMLHTGMVMSAYVMHGSKRVRWGHRTPGIYPYTILHCKDGYVSLIAIQGYQWKRFLDIIGDGQVPEWYANDPRFKDRREVSFKYADELDKRLEPWLMEHTREQIYRLCQEKKIPFTPVKQINEVLADRHLRERGYFVEIEHPQAGKLKYPGAPFKLSETPWGAERSAPLLGEHNKEIFCDRLGYTEQQLGELRKGGVI